MTVLFYCITNKELTKSTVKVSDVANQSISATITGNLFLSIFLGFSLSKMWSLVCYLQIITAFPMMKFSFPANVNYYLKNLREVSNLNLIPKEYMLKAT